MTEVDQLPERLRVRVVALVAAVLPSVTPLPPQLRKVAGFAPARRARLGGQPIRDALADDDFRRHAGVQVAAVPARDDDRIDLAARAWLVREDGWEDVVAAVADELGHSEDAAEAGSAELERLEARAAALQAELASVREDHAKALEEARSEHKVLRQRLGRARADLRAVEEERDHAVAERDRAVAEAAAATAQAEADVRRARQQAEDAERALTTARREGRTSRDQATVRARYLLDTVLEAAAGLRRELGLPAVEGAPGDVVEAELSGGAAPTSSAPATADTLEQTLSMPRARLLVDGYNVSKQTWGSATLEAQRSRLVTALGPLVARTGAETTVVFDAAASSARTVMPAPRGVKVAFSPEGVIADDVIRQLVAAEPRGRVVVVVTSDRALAADVTREGARVVPSPVLVGLLG
ncbi:NYN domain-containing protein [Nocardioides sp. J2M5]|uniref:NYN domain-containing protein n=1 Tax=Nocardioides palaemonis TaxID=2829810 RepID=UPI001BA6F5E6|nr:NYN domain-containing protein [Nocardioides palaemonis]MBS2937534.1 NYN domain-containing protein [Nocardioides palaemonis]